MRMSVKFAYINLSLQEQMETLSSTNVKRRVQFPSLFPNGHSVAESEDNDT